jgi:hypothetical protein
MLDGRRQQTGTKDGTRAEIKNQQSQESSAVTPPAAWWTPEGYILGQSEALIREQNRKL